MVFKKDEYGCPHEKREGLGYHKIGSMSEVMVKTDNPEKIYLNIQIILEIKY